MLCISNNRHLDFQSGYLDLLIARLLRRVAAKVFFKLTKKFIYNRRKNETLFEQR